MSRRQDLIILFGVAQNFPPAPPPTTNYILQEDGFNILLEDGGKIQLEAGS